ncbi:hypothetical protein [Sphingomonas alba]|uniref:ATPase n=1 Tax=Sphingomonas alba TaxID=2908208 RepID=A0ABT0RIH4_9SPHN|nr:hypothetical protein [Sphingomonas alba]MCL6682397.1 hypothetical protein [Sphingomonas alba]
MTATPHRAEPIPQPAEDAPIEAMAEHQDYSAQDAEWLAPQEEPQTRGAGGRAVLGWALGLLAALWLAYTAWSAGRELANQPLTSPAIAQWVAVAAGPLALLGLAWLIFGRTRRREAEAFTRSVITMRSEARSLEALLGVLSQRIDENHASLNVMANQLMGLGDEAATRLGTVTRDLEAGSQRLAQHGEALDKAANTARVDIGVLLEDLPRAEASAQAMAAALRATGNEASEKAAKFEVQVGSLTERAREADTVVGEAAQRLLAQVADIQSAGAAASAQISASASLSGTTMDALLQRAAEALEEIRSGIDLQAAAVAALLEQATAGLGRVGVEAADALGKKLESASGSLDNLTARIAEQERTSQRMVADIGMGVATLDEQFVQMAANGETRAASIVNALNRMRTELEGLSQQSGAHEGSIDGLAERTSVLRQSVEQLATEIGAAQSGAERVLVVAQQARPEIEWAHQASLEAGSRLEAGAGAIEAQHDRLAALLAAVDTGVGGAEKRLAELAEAVRAADAEASRLSAETGPALVASLLQVKEAAAHAAERARESISAVIPESAGNLSEATRLALEQVVRETVARQLSEVETTAARALEAARGVSERLTAQMINIGQSAAALDAHLQETTEAQRQHDSENFAKRVSLLIDSMHSASIDVGKILSDEVDDRAWASYMKGDRGVFTRRASRLIGGTEAKAIASHYDTDHEFHDSANRYVHDFEAMLRRVHAERDGGLLAVTLMSSDMGKLYVALSQAIAR